MSRMTSRFFVQENDCSGLAATIDGGVGNSAVWIMGRRLSQVADAVPPTSPLSFDRREETLLNILTASRRTRHGRRPVQSSTGGGNESPVAAAAPEASWHRWNSSCIHGSGTLPM